MKTCNIGLLGCGGRGKNAWKAHCPEKGFRITAGFDVNLDFLDAFAKAFPSASTFTDWNELLAMPELDAVFISSPIQFHAQMTLAAIAAGKAVFLEKPMATTVEECDRIIDAASAAGTKLFVGHNLRSYPFLSSLKEVAASGAIGEVKTIWCRHFVGIGHHGDDFFHAPTTPKYSHGLLLHKGCHDIDAIHYLAGSCTARVAGTGTFTDFPGEHREDLNMLLLELENGIRATYLQCHYAPDDFRNYTVIGTKGRVENIGSNYENSTIRLWSNRDGDCVYSEFPTPPVGNAAEYADALCVGSFLEYLRSDAPPSITPEAARNAVAAALGGHRSMRGDGSFCDIPIRRNTITLPHRR